MSKMVCVGGPSDGARVEVPEHHRDMRVRNPGGLGWVFLGPIVGDDRQTIAEPPFTLYVRSSLNYSFGTKVERVEFLVPEGTPVDESLRSLIEGYHP